MNLVLLEARDVDRTGHATLSDARAAHLRHVLGVAPGRAVRIGLVDGPFGTGTVTGVHGDAVTMWCAFDSEPPPRPRIDLLLALPRPKVMQRLWAQLAALGVGRIILTNAERVERHYFDTHVLSENTYRPLLIDGLQQTRDTHLPRVSIHRRFKVLIEDDLDALFPEGRRIVADPSARAPIQTIIHEREAPRWLVAVGPEGGWNAFERDLLLAHGFEAAGMGSRTLRSDTACVALLALAHAAMDADGARPNPSLQPPRESR